MHYIYRNNGFVTYSKWLIIYNNMLFNRWCSGVFIFFFKNIVKPFFKFAKYPIMGIYGYISLPEEKRPYIVKSCGMIGMFMCKQYTVQPVTATSKHLLPEIRAAINHKRGIVPLYPNGYSQTLIFRIITLANSISTPYNRYALRCSCPYKPYFNHTLNFYKNRIYLLLKVLFFLTLQISLHVHEIKRFWYHSERRQNYRARTFHKGQGSKD